MSRSPRKEIVFVGLFPESMIGVEIDRERAT
jgi:hypothetical protein